MKSNISKTLRDRDEVSMEIRLGNHIWAFEWYNSFDPGWPSEVKGQGQTPKTLKSNISKTVRDRKMVSI